MKYAFLGKTGVRISKLAFGTMSFLGDADRPTSIALFHAAREAGINLFDCADVYNGGQSEELLGELVAGCRDQVVVTTKAYFPTSDDVNGRGMSRYHLVRALEGSLRRLKMDYVDIFFLHRFDDETALEESLRAADDLVRQGKALYVGISNFAAWQTMKAHGIAERDRLAPIACLQPMYNLAKRQAEVEILPMASAERIGVIPYSPLGGGLFSGKYRDGKRQGDGRLTKSKMYMTRYGDPAYDRIADAFVRLAEERGHHPAALAVAWCAAHPAVTAPIIGARSLDQLRPVLGAADIDMTPELYDAICALSPRPGPATDRNEEKTAHNYGQR
jgi:aryl-alcohol dehydrogenase-like predicted oxidoreductase